MDSLPFSALVVACFAALLGVRFGLEAGLPAPTAAALEADREAGGAMAVPPKPAGLTPAAGDGTGEGDTLLTPDTCVGMVEKLRPTCWQALARQTAGADPEEALRVCGRLTDTELLYECQADVAEAVAPLDRAFSLRVCGAVPAVKWRGQCHFGMGLALAETDPEYAVSLCDKAENFYEFCRHDVLGEAAMVDTTVPLAVCSRNEGTRIAQKTCWHGPGKYLARRDMLEAAAFCDRTPPEHRRMCYHGLGWGGAERDVDAALASCAGFGDYADNCRHGVANQLKRSDPVREQAICESLTNPEAKAKCLAFVTQ